MYLAILQLHIHSATILMPLTDLALTILRIEAKQRHGNKIDTLKSIKHEAPTVLSVFIEYFYYSQKYSYSV